MHPSMPMAPPAVGGGSSQILQEILSSQRPAPLVDGNPTKGGGEVCGCPCWQSPGGMGLGEATLGRHSAKVAGCSSRSL